MPFLNVNTDASVRLTSRLERLNRSAFPVAVRGALNDAAFDMKRNTLPASAKASFVTRSPSFFRTFSGVQKATGFDVNSMRATVGMSDMGKSSARTAVQHMEQQEQGGRVSGGLDYLSAARGGSNARKVSRSNYFKRSNVIGGPMKRNLISDKANFVAKAFAAQKSGKLMRSGRYYIKVTSIKKLKNDRVKIHSKLVSQVRDQPVTLKARHFVRNAAMDTAQKIPGFYVAQAEKQFARALR